MQQADIAAILGKSRPAVAHYQNPVPGKARKPDFDDLVKLGLLFAVDANWLQGHEGVEMWGPDIIALRNRWRQGAEDMPKEISPYRRILRVIDLVKETLPAAKQPWWLPSVLKLGGESAVENIELYDQFVTGASVSEDQLSSAVSSLAEITGLSSMWLQLGDQSTLSPISAEILNQWSSICADLTRHGISPEDMRKHLPTVRQLIKSYTTPM